MIILKHDTDRCPRCKSKLKEYFKFMRFKEAYKKCLNCMELILITNK